MTLCCKGLDSREANLNLRQKGLCNRLHIHETPEALQGVRFVQGVEEVTGVMGSGTLCCVHRSSPKAWKLEHRAEETLHLYLGIQGRAGWAKSAGRASPIPLVK